MLIKMNTSSNFHRLTLLVVIAAILSSAFAPEQLIDTIPVKANVAPSFSQLNLYPNIETAGVAASGSNLPKTAQLFYRQTGEVNWRTGHNLMRIDDGRLVGSLFGLAPSTSYEVKVVDGVNEIAGSLTTQPDELQFTPTSVLRVDDNAQPGGDGSALMPFKSIQEAVNRALPGTQVLVADGVYHETVTFPASGTAGNWIQVKAEGSGAILDGSESIPPESWKPYESKTNVWFTKIGPGIKYLGRNQQRFYQYDDLNGLLDGRGHNKVPMNEGWFYDPLNTRLYIRIQQDPIDYSWQLPRYNQAFFVDGRDWVWIEGFEMRFYGTEYGCGVCAKDSSHIVIRKNRIHNLQNGVFISWTGGEERGNDTRIEYNEISDPPLNEWPWKAVKATSMEATAIVLRGHIGAIVRGNHIHHYFNGIYTSSSAALDNPGVAFDADIYNNNLHHISDDALEPEGTCVNHRFRNNTIDTVLVGVSLAPVTMGPVWVMRSTITNFTGRSIKWDRNSDGWVLIYHNTSWTNLANMNLMEMISPVHHSVMRNNIFQGNGYAIEEQQLGSTDHDWNNDNWSTTRRPYRFKWENVEYAAINELCRATGLECNGHEESPGLVNPAGGNFSLSPTSPNVDRGALIPGINDSYIGSAPDIGAFEYAVDIPPGVSSITRADADPTNSALVNFIVTFSEPVTGVDAMDFSLSASSGVVNPTIASITPISGTTYRVGVTTESGNGTVHLDVIDDDSIRDSANNPLGGADAGNGNFTTGEFYTIDRTLLTVTSILRTDPTPTSADTVHFAVTFSEAVTGVDASDFTLAPTGNIAGAGIVEVSGSDSIYSVSVNTGIGDGTLQLNLVDDDSILDSLNRPLNGLGVGNGSYNSGEVYTVDKSTPIVASILRTDADPTSADLVGFTVIFSESVSGVDAGDFVLTTTGNISNAIVAAVGGSNNIYHVIAATGQGNGTLRLDVVDNESILDGSNQPLGGVGAGNGNFTAGEVYTVNKSVAVIRTETFTSAGANDGWVLESSEGSNLGGTKNSTETTFVLGDDKQDRQYRAILHFPTDSLPDNAFITLAILMIRRQGLIGSDPFPTHKNILIDIKYGAFGPAGLFGTNSLQIADFQSTASRNAVGTIQNNPVGGWYWSNLDSTAYPYINLTGPTQFRLRFSLDDNDDRGADYLKFFSGNFNALSDRPHLRIEYYIP